jgi:hypothetical protein
VIVTPKHARAIETGRKTQARQPILGARCRYKPGHDYSIQPGRGKPSVCRIQIVNILEQQLGDITHKDARAEGHRDIVAFKGHWVRAHDRAWVDRQETSVDAAGVIDVDRYLSDLDLRPRFEARHAHRLVHVITFKLLTDSPLFLASQRDILTGRAADSGEYTTRRDRAIDDLEVIDTATMQRYAALAEADSLTRRIGLQRDLAAAQAARKAERRPWIQAA